MNAPARRPFLFPRRLASAAALLLAFSGLAHAQAPGLEEALARADERTAVVQARLERADAERIRQRTEADPLALRAEQLQAQQDEELAAAELRAARFDSYLEIAEAYGNARLAEERVQLAERARTLAERSLEIAELRRERGGATDLEVREAANELADAEQNLDAARQGRALARANLESLTGLEAAELQPLSPRLLEAELPAMSDLIEQLDGHPSLLAARHGVELAKVSRDLLDPSYAPRNQIEQAELRLEQAQEGLTEARRGLRLQLQGLHDEARAAAERARVAREALANSERREELERQRLDAGLIAEIDFEQTRLATMQARLSAREAEHDYLLALFRLQAQSAVPIDGFHGF